MNTRTTEEPARLLRAGEAARMLGISERFLWSLASRGDLPAIRIGEKATRWRRADVENFIERCAAEGGQGAVK